MVEWRDVYGFEGLYKVSSTGQVFSYQSNDYVNPFDNEGYLRVGLRKDGKPVKKLVHRLVAKAFIGQPPFEDAQINHKDLDKTNNNVSNLEWVTGSENVRHSIRNRKGRAKYLRKTMSKIGEKYWYLGVQATKKPVAQLDKETGEVINVFESARDAGRVTGAKYKGISQVCTGRRRTHMGYRWEFVQQERCNDYRNHA